MRVAFYKPLVRPSFLGDARRSRYLGFASLIAWRNRLPNDDEFVPCLYARDIRKSKPDAIGLSSVTETFPRLCELVAKLREDGFSGPIWVGGPHITALPETLPVGATCGVCGAGELAFERLCDGMEPQDVPGACWRDDSGLHVNPREDQPALDDIPIDVTAVPGEWFEIPTIRGCPYHCTHCVEGPNHGKVRSMSAEYLLDIMAKRVEATGNRDFFFQDDSFLSVPGRLDELHRLVLERGLARKFRVFLVSMNANQVHDGTIPKLKDVGTVMAGFGMESLNDRILKLFKRGVVTREHIEQAITYSRKAGVRCGGSLVCGYPSETRAEMEESLQRMGEQRRIGGFGMFEVV